MIDSRGQSRAATDVEFMELQDRILAVQENPSGLQSVRNMTHAHSKAQSTSSAIDQLIVQEFGGGKKSSLMQK